MYLTYVFFLPPFVRITGIRFYGYNLSPCFLGTPLFQNDQNDTNVRLRVHNQDMPGKNFVSHQKKQVSHVLLLATNFYL